MRLQPSASVPAIAVPGREIPPPRAITIKTERKIMWKENHSEKDAHYALALALALSLTAGPADRLRDAGSWHPWELPSLGSVKIISLSAPEVHYNGFPGNNQWGNQWLVCVASAV